MGLLIPPRSLVQLKAIFTYLQLLCAPKNIAGLLQLLYTEGFSLFIIFTVNSYEESYCYNLWSLFRAVYNFTSVQFHQVYDRFRKLI